MNLLYFLNLPGVDPPTSLFNGTGLLGCILGDGEHILAQQ